MPAFVHPMLATLIKEPFNDEDWLFEIKLDGFRALARIDRNVELLSRNEKSFNLQFQPIVKDLEKLNAQAILDGEIVVLDKEGKSHFQLIQNYQRLKQKKLYYYVFDLLYLNGKDLRDLPLIERKELLKQLIENSSLQFTRYSDHIVKQGKEFFKEAKKKSLEGIMAKKMDSTYISKRSRDWLKIKTHMRQEAVIGGFTAPRGSRKNFGALLLGIYDKEKNFNYIGHTGGGFNQASLKDVYTKMKPLIQKNCPFKTTPKTNEKAFWIKPKLICEVTFGEWTSDGRMRQPIFEGLREDKKPSDVKRELVVEVAKQDKLPNTNPKEVKITNRDKIFWPSLKLTKGDLIDYYLAISSYILPYLKNRPLTLRRFPNGVKGESFFQKDTKNLKLPSWIETVEIQHVHRKNSYFLIQDQPSLEYIVNLGTIEMHPFLSQINSPQFPDYFIIDLDPEAIAFSQVIETAQALYKILDEFEIPNYCKTSGKRGLHVCIPLGRKYTYQQALDFGQIITTYAHAKLPDLTSLERQPAKRQKRIYLDILQNHYMQTVVAPYSVRGTEDATVSTPLRWSEIKKGMVPEDFNMKTLPKRLKSLGDIFVPVLEKGINIPAILKKIERKLKNESS